MTNERELLELAAKAMGLDYHTDYFWNPAYSQADSADLRDALEIDVEYFSSYVLVTDANADGRFVRAAHNGTIEDRSRAVREAVLMVAAEIGRKKP